MGNLLGKSKKRNPQNSRSDKGGRILSNIPVHEPIPLPLTPQVASMSKKSSFGTHNSGQSSNTKKPLKKYALIQDNFTTLEQVYMFHIVIFSITFFLSQILVIINLISIFLLASKKIITFIKSCKEFVRVYMYSSTFLVVVSFVTSF